MIDERPPTWMVIAERELASGVRERPGAEHNPRIVEYHSATLLRATTDEVPWCSSFANWCLLQVFETGTWSAAARSWLAWGVPATPRYGAIIVLARGSHPAQGHVGFYVRERGEHVLLLGGNQGNAVSIAAYPRARVLAYRWPAVRT